MSTVSNQFAMAVQHGKNAAMRGDPRMTRSALAQSVSPDMVDPLLQAYMQALSLSGGGQRGGDCKSKFQRNWMHLLVLSAMASGFGYVGGFTVIKGGATTAAAVGQYVWGLLTGTSTCTITPGAATVGSTLCIELSKFGYAIRETLSTGKLQLTNAAKGVIPVGAFLWGSGKALKSAIGTSGDAYNALVDQLCGIVFDDNGNFFITAFWAGLNSVATKATPGMSPAAVVAAVREQAPAVALQSAAVEGMAPPAEAAALALGSEVASAAAAASAAGPAPATGRKRGGYSRRHQKTRKGRKALKKHKKSRKSVRKTRRH
jgi:hypothetical protein